MFLITDPTDAGPRWNGHAGVGIVGVCAVHAVCRSSYAIVGRFPAHAFTHALTPHPAADHADDSHALTEPSCTHAAYERSNPVYNFLTDTTNSEATCNTVRFSWPSSQSLNWNALTGGTVNSQAMLTYVQHDAGAHNSGRCRQRRDPDGASIVQRICMHRGRHCGSLRG